MGEQEPAREWGAEIKDLGDKIANLRLIEAKQLSDYLKEVHGIEAAAGATVMMAPGAGGEAGGEEAKEKTVFDVILSSFGEKKIQVIKTVREITGLGLKEAKALVDGAPKAVKEDATKEEAEEIKSKLEGQGATVEIK